MHYHNTWHLSRWATTGSKDPELHFIGVKITWNNNSYLFLRPSIIGKRIPFIIRRGPTLYPHWKLSHTSDRNPWHPGCCLVTTRMTWTIYSFGDPKRNLHVSHEPASRQWGVVPKHIDAKNIPKIAMFWKDQSIFQKNTWFFGYLCKISVGVHQQVIQIVWASTDMWYKEENIFVSCPPPKKKKRWYTVTRWKINMEAGVFTWLKRKIIWTKPSFPGCQLLIFKGVYMGVSKNSGTPKSSILIGFSMINHPFWGTPIFGNTHISIVNDLS